MAPPALRDRAVQMLRRLAAYLELSGENAFKVRAYHQAADRLAGLEEPLEPLLTAGNLASLKGVGASTASKVDELWRTGRVEALEALAAKYPKDVLELLEVPALGPKKVAALVEALGVGSVGALEQALAEGRVRGLKGFGEKSEAALRESIALYRRTRLAGGRRPLGEALPQAEALLARLEGLPGVVRASVAGSARRWRETVADVDLIASAADPGPIFDAFVAAPDVVEVIGRGESKASVRLASDLQVDLRVLPDADFATALHHFTGSRQHHVALRGLAQSKGLQISEWGVFRGDEKLPIADEAALYGALGLPFIPPELREDRGELEAAAAGALPADLITEADLRGNVHAHSTWSDGKDSLEAMARAAQALGLSYLTVTEHSQSSGYANGLDLDRLKAQWDEIDALNERLKGFVLLKGIESDILADGSLDYPDAVLARFDVVIGSIHQRYGQDEEAMTRRVLSAFDNPHLMIWGHPTGRLLGKRDPAPLRMEQILDKAAERGIVLEVNGCPERLDLNDDAIRLALARGLRLSLSTDAHSVAELSTHRRFAVGTARRAGVQPAHVINCLTGDHFRAAVSARRSKSTVNGKSQAR